jgi:hypothetical protein
MNLDVLLAEKLLVDAKEINTIHRRSGMYRISRLRVNKVVISDSGKSYLSCVLEKWEAARRCFPSKNLIV